PGWQLEVAHVDLTPVPVRRRRLLQPQDLLDRRRLGLADAVEAGHVEHVPLDAAAVHTGQPAGQPGDRPPVVAQGLQEPARRGRRLAVESWLRPALLLGSLVFRRAPGSAICGSAPATPA